MLDLIIKDINVFNVYFKKFIKSDVGIIDGKFLYVDCIDDKLTAKEVIEGSGKYMIPGLIDIHMHIESSMTTPNQFAKKVIEHGVTTVVADPHEIANVFGVEGIKAMIDSYTENTVDIFYGIPSSVPSTSSKFETTGAEINLGNISELLELDEMKCLGEVMNAKDLISDEVTQIKQIIECVSKEQPHFRIEGHCPKITGLDLAKYIYNGVDADHTQQTVDSLQAKIKNGMFMEIQKKSMSKANIDYLVENALYEHFCLVTDDVMVDHFRGGHLNLLVKEAIELGMPIEMAIYVATYTPARRMLLHDRGAIAPGKIADFLILDNLNNFNIKDVYKSGRLVKKCFSQENKDSTVREEQRAFPQHFYNSVKVNFESVEEKAFEIEAPVENGKLAVYAMKVSSHTTFTEETCVEVEAKDGYAQWENQDYALIKVIERYGKSNSFGEGFVLGDIFKRGAVCTTYAHDHHNLTVMGYNAKDMAMASQWVVEHQGGMCVVEDGVILASMALPVGGILSEEPIEILGEQLRRIRHSLKSLGYKHHNEIMSLSTLTLPVSPQLKITDQGLIRVVEQEILPLFKEV